MIIASGPNEAPRVPAVISDLFIKKVIDLLIKVLDWIEKNQSVSWANIEKGFDVIKQKTLLFLKEKAMIAHRQFLLKKNYFIV